MSHTRLMPAYLDRDFFEAEGTLSSAFYLVRGIRK
jgi:hypothetical protein